MKPHRIALYAVLFTSSLGASLGCATDAMRPQTQTWGEAGSSDYRSKDTKADSKEKLMTATEYAARFTSSAECELEARRVVGENPKGGEALFRACLAREDFLEIEPFVTNPWKPLLADQAGMIELGRIIAARGGYVADDLTTLQRDDLTVLALTQAIEQPEVARGKIVITRARYIEGRKDVPGQLVFEEATLTPDDDLLDEQEDDGPADSTTFPTVLTGHRVLFELPDQQKPFRSGDELVIVGEFLGNERLMNREVGEEQDWAVLRVLARYTPSTRLRQ